MWLCHLFWHHLFNPENKSDINTVSIVGLHEDSKGWETNFASSPAFLCDLEDTIQTQNLKHSYPPHLFPSFPSSPYGFTKKTADFCSCVTTMFLMFWKYLSRVFCIPACLPRMLNHFHVTGTKLNDSPHTTCYPDTLENVLFPNSQENLRCFKKHFSLPQSSLQLHCPIQHSAYLVTGTFLSRESTRGVPVHVAITCRFVVWDSLPLCGTGPETASH